MKLGNTTTGILIVIIFAILCAYLLVVAAGMVRISVLRLRGALSLQRIREKSIKEFFRSLSECLKPFSISGILKLTFDNPRGGAVLLAALIPAAFLVMAIVAIVGNMLLNLFPGR